MKRISIGAVGQVGGWGAPCCGPRSRSCLGHAGVGCPAAKKERSTRNTLHAVHIPSLVLEADGEGEQAEIQRRQSKRPIRPGTETTKRGQSRSRMQTNNVVAVPVLGCVLGSAFAPTATTHSCAHAVRGRVTQQPPVRDKTRNPRNSKTESAHTLKDGSQGDRRDRPSCFVVSEQSKTPQSQCQSRCSKNEAADPTSCPALVFVCEM